MRTIAAMAALFGGSAQRRGEAMAIHVPSLERER
jgi:hypothetical protein